MNPRLRPVAAGVFAGVLATAAFLLGHDTRPADPAGRAVAVVGDVPLLGIPVEPAIAETVRRFLDTWTTPGPLDDRRSALRALVTGAWVDACATDDPAELPHGRLVAVTNRIDRPNVDGTLAGIELDVVVADSTRLHIRLEHTSGRWLIAGLQGGPGQC